MQKSREEGNRHEIIISALSGSSYILKKRNFIAEIGAQQGSVLGPKLFLHFIDRLLQSLEERGIKVLAYADDIAIVSNNRDVMESGLHALKQWTGRYKVRININPNGTKTVSSSPGVYFGGIEILVLPAYKYLGLRFDRKGLDWKGILPNKASSIRRRSFDRKKNWDHKKRISMEIQSQCL